MSFEVGSTKTRSRKPDASDTSRVVCDLRGACFPNQPNKEVRAIMSQARSSRSLLVNLFASASLFAAVSGVAMAQQVALSLGSGSTIAGGSVSLNLSLTVSGGAQPTALQWTMAYSASDVSGVTVTPGAVATAAAKSVTCSSSLGSTRCVVYGVNDNAMGSGVLATVTLTIASGTHDTSAAVSVASVGAVNALGTSIPGAGVGGSITIVQVSSVSCNPSSVVAPGTSACTVTLSAAAPAGGVSVALSSNNANVTVPASVTVAAGATTGAFTATVASVSTAQTATLTATLGGSSQTFLLTISPTLTVSSLSCNPASVVAPGPRHAR